jgi:hypothetical protein
MLGVLSTHQKSDWPTQDLDNLPRPPPVSVPVLLSQVYLLNTSTKLSFTKMRKDPHFISVRLPFELKVDVRSYYYPAVS